MTIQTHKQLMNVGTATAITYCCIPDFVSTNVRTAIIATVSAAALTIPDSQQDNFRLVSSIAGGATISWRLMPENTSAKGFALYTLFASVAAYLVQEKIEKAFESNPTIVVQATNSTNQSAPISLLSAISPTTLLNNIVAQTIPQTGPQTVLQTAQMQQNREQVGNR